MRTKRNTDTDTRALWCPPACRRYIQRKRYRYVLGVRHKLGPISQGYQIRRGPDLCLTPSTLCPPPRAPSPTLPISVPFRNLNTDPAYLSSINSSRIVVLLGLALARRTPHSKPFLLLQGDPPPPSHPRRRGEGCITALTPIHVPIPILITRPATCPCKHTTSAAWDV